MITQMNRLSLTSWIASGALHALALLPLVHFVSTTPAQVFSEGVGELEHGMIIETVSFGDAGETRVTPAVEAMTANPAPPPVVETKTVEPEVKSVITATQSATETAAVPDETPPPVAPHEVAVRDQAAQEEMNHVRSAGAGGDGGKLAALTMYIGKIQSALYAVKPDRRIKATGKVVLGVTVDSSGRVRSREVVISSGIASIDKAAMEMVDRANFPPPPEGVDTGQRYNIPISWQTKSKPG